MAKKAGRRAGKRTSKKKRAGKKGGNRLTAAQKKAKSAAVKKRVQLHQAASMLKDFHGGKLPIRSGCGRPRKHPPKA